MIRTLISRVTLTTPPRALSLPCYAKVNLALAVGPPEPPSSPKPGFHPICSWFACVDLHDDVQIAPGEGASAYHLAWAPDAGQPSPIDWPLERDLCVRAHRALEAHVGRALPVTLRLHKRIPVGGGLGGGSSNAASTLRGVCEVHALRVPRDELHALAMSLGSDVAFFLDLDQPASRPPRPALVEGFGERLARLTPLAGASAGIVLIFPPFGCPTGAVYRALDRAPPPALRTRDVRALIERARDGAIDSAALFNDLAAPAEQVAPGLGPLRARLAQALGTPVHVTGSGSTLLALGDAPALAARARAACPEAVALPARLV